MNKTLKAYRLIAELQNLIEGDEELKGIVRKEMFEQEEPEPSGPENTAHERRELTKEEQEAIISICDSWGD
ncbi:MAG: hypothetical protein IJK79_05455 [Bacteroidales bacterium]|nr:hypothetical protein [Bacteroidales bacterium]